MSIRISQHVRQRLEQRAGVAMSDQDVLDLVPEQDQARIARGEDVVVRAPRLKLDPIFTTRTIVSAIPSHRRITTGSAARPPAGPWRGRGRPGWGGDRRGRSGAEG